MSSRPPPKRPSGGRPNVRKLLSKDSLSSFASLSKHAQSDSRDDVPARTGTLQTSLPSLNERPAGRDVKLPWMEEGFVSSPTPSREGHDPFDEYPVQANTRSVKFKEASLNTPSEQASSIRSAGQSTSSFEDPSRSSTPPAQPVSPSKLRWEQLRQHVLPTSSVASSPNPSFTSFSQLNLAAPAPVPYTPRPSRLATRFGFRQVVNEAREAADDISRRFADEIQKSCWSVRFGEGRPSKPEREASQPSTLGSTLHLPFMSSASLPLSGNPSSNNLSAPSSFKYGLRAATSMANLTSHGGSRSSSLANLKAVITRFASFTMQYGALPHEKEVLSVLLIPFLCQTSGQDIEDERQISLELFELVIQKWKTSYAEVSFNRF